MLKLDWHEPKFISQRNFSIASDTSTANLYILRKKYNTEVAELNGILFRRYNGSILNHTKCIVIYIVHAVPKFISSGIYPAIYRFIASTEENSTYEYINLEEDLGFLNLRRSKETYYPIFKIKKYYGEVFN